MARSRHSSLDLPGFMYNSLFPEKSYPLVKIIAPVSYEPLISYKDNKITQSILANIKLDSNFNPPKQLDVTLAELNDTENQNELWKRGTSNLAQHQNPILGFFIAKKCGHLPLAHQFFQCITKNGFIYYLIDGKTAATYHMNALFSATKQLPKRKELESNPTKKASFITALSQPDVCGELAIFSALQAGNKEIFKLYFDYTQAEYPICMLPLYALQSRNTVLASIFMDKLIAQPRDIYTKYGSFDTYVEWLFIYAKRHTQNPGAELTTLLLGISDEKTRTEWLVNFRELALSRNYSDIFTALARGFILEDSDAQIEIICGLFIDTIDNPSPMINLSKLVVETFLPYLQAKPVRLCEVILQLNEIGAEEHIDFEEVRLYSRKFLMFIPEQLKKVAAEHTKENDAIDLLRSPNLNPTHNGNAVIYKLFEQSNQSKQKNVPLTNFKPLLGLLAKEINENKATLFMYHCAANLGFLLKDERAAEWYQVKSPSTSVCVSGLRILGTKLAILFSEINQPLPISFVNAYKNNLYDLIDNHSFIFHLPIEALFVISELSSEKRNFKNLLSRIKSTRDTLPDFKDNEIESWNDLYSLRQATLIIQSLLQKFYNKISTEMPIPPEQAIISQQNENIALLELALHFTYFYNTVATKLNLPADKMLNTRNIDHEILIASLDISRAETILEEMNDKKNRMRIEEKQQQEKNALIKKIQSSKRSRNTENPSATKNPNSLNAKLPNTELKLEEKKVSSITVEGFEESLKKRAKEIKLENEIKAIAKDEKRIEKEEREAKEKAAAEAKRIDEEIKKAENKARQIAKPEQKIKIEAVCNTIVEPEPQPQGNERDKLEAVSLITKHELIQPNITKPTNDYDLEINTSSLSSSNEAPKSNQPQLNPTPVVILVPIPVLPPYQMLQIQQAFITQELLHQQQMQYALQIQHELQQQLKQQVLFLQDESSRPLAAGTATQIPRKLSATESFFTFTKLFDVPEPLAILYKMFEGRIFEVGGCIRDYHWGVDPDDRDIWLFATLATLELALKQLKVELTQLDPRYANIVIEPLKKPTESFASYRIGDHLLIDTVLHPCGSREENIGTLIASVANRDLTMNSLFREYSASGCMLIDRWQGQGKKDIKGCRFELANPQFSNQNFMLHQIRFYRFIFLKHKALSLGKKPSYGDLLLANLAELARSRAQFIKNCGEKKNKKAIRRFLDKKIAKDKVRGFRILLEEQQESVLIQAGVYTEEEMKLLREGFLTDFIRCIFSLRHSESSLFNIANTIWRYLGLNECSAMLCASKSMSKFSLFAKANETYSPIEPQQVSQLKNK